MLHGLAMRLLRARASRTLSQARARISARLEREKRASARLGQFGDTGAVVKTPAEAEVSLARVQLDYPPSGFMS
jgi:hypothetical protein